MSTERCCWVCGCLTAQPFLDGNLDAPVNSDSLRITDSHYGRTAPLVQCTDCGFIYADPPPADDLVALYEGLEDPDYVKGADYRLEQMRHLLDAVLDGGRPATLLDVGAGSGLLVQAAHERGIDAVGVEPSRSLAAEGRAAGRRVLTGVLPHEALEGQQFACVTCADVIEHVRDPVGLLQTLADAVQPGGRIVVTTPDVESLAARTLRGRWWHYRVAHVCFFPERAFNEAARRAGLVVLRRQRQRWWFSVPYLAARVLAMMGSTSRSAGLQARLERTPLRRAQLPVDLKDSWVYTLEVAR